MSSVSSNKKKKKLPEPPHFHFRILEEEDSLLPSLQWIKEIQSKYKISSSSVLIGLDFDGTISNLKRINTEENKEVVIEPKEYIRGGEESITFMKAIDTLKYKWFVVSARSYDEEQIKDIQTSLKVDMQLPFPPSWDHKNKKKEEESYLVPISFKKFLYKEEEEEEEEQEENKKEKPTSYEILESSNIVGALDPKTGYALEKHIALEYIINVYNPKCKLLVFIDDDSNNINLVFNHFHNLYSKGKNPNLHLLFIFYYPQKKVKLADAFLRLKIIQNLL